MISLIEKYLDVAIQEVARVIQGGNLFIETEKEFQAEKTEHNKTKKNLEEEKANFEAAKKKLEAEK